MFIIDLNVLYFVKIQDNYPAACAVIKELVHSCHTEASLRVEVSPAKYTSLGGNPSTSLGMTLIS